jgi:hypothetical protein
MAIYFETKTPKKLLSAFKKAIDDGHIITWGYDQDGDFTHTAEQWKSRAWLRPTVQEGTALLLHIIKPRNTNITTELYAIYHGRFIEAMLRHCDELFSDGRATAMPEAKDNVG